MATARTSRKTQTPSVHRKQRSWIGRFAAQRYAMPLVFIVAFAAIGGAITLFLTNAASTAGGPIMGVASKCLDNNQNNKINGNKIQLYTCNGTAAQQWTANSNGTITNANDYCLDVKGAGTVKGTIVQLYTCNGTVAQQWSIKSNGSIVNPHSALCLDDKYSAGTNGNQIWMYTCNSTAAQKWTIKIPSTPTPIPTPTPTPPSRTDPSGQAMPVGDLTGWHQVFADDFTGTVPVGAFSDCNHNTDTPQAYCGGLKNYGSYYTNWWAYPSGWPDTSEECILKQSACPEPSLKIPSGGTYEPQKAVSVSGGAMHIVMSHPTSGTNIVATVVPRACMDQEYGLYTERLKVKSDPGFKSAHLFYENGYEMDYPENDYGNTIYAYTHPGGESFNSGVAWTSGWHTTTIQWTASSIKFYMDGKLIGTATKNIPHLKMSWALQNESSIEGPYAKASATAQLDEDWVACYSQS
ncbi:MAG: ricin-type beta-trefoil lectin domain protein [Candidatus Saccharibacteria bacterium]